MVEISIRKTVAVWMDVVGWQSSSLDVALVVDAGELGLEQCLVR